MFDQTKSVLWKKETGVGVRSKYLKDNLFVSLHLTSKTCLILVYLLLNKLASFKLPTNFLYNDVWQLADPSQSSYTWNCVQNL